MDLISKVITACTVWMGIAVAAPAIWDGTADVSWYEEQPNGTQYNLKTAEQLAGLAQLVNNGNSFAGKKITLGADILLNDTAGAAGGTWASVARTPWIPIGTASHPFKGEFDGIAGKKNRKIYGLYFNDTTKSNVGLFGYTNGVIISNLDLPVGRVTAANNTGALVGCAISGSITNVHSEIKVTGKNYVGGLIGYYTGSISKSSVQENVVGQDSVGGLVGYTSGSITGTSSANSYFVGNVSGRKYVGGLAGYTTGSVTGSHSEGDVTGTGNYIGGLIGLSYYYYSGSADQTIVVVDSSYSIGNVKGASYVGGLIGLDSIYRYSNNTYRLERQIKRSYAQGSVEGAQFTGGVLGRSYYGSKSSSYLSNFYSTINSVSHTKGNVSGTSYVGGLVGYTYASVTGSHSEGDVTGTADYVGGLVGYATSSVTSSHSSGYVTGRKYVGGAVGYGSSISKTYVEGVVKGDSSYVGGLAGCVVGTVVSTYHIGGNVTGTNYVGGLVGFGSSVGSSYHEDGNVSGKDYIGGLAGYTTGSVTGSHSAGDVTGTGNYIGGLIGLSYYYYSGSAAQTIVVVDSSYSIGNVKGASYVGGLIGLDSIYRYSYNTYRLERQIKRSYAQGLVEGAQFTGGVLGRSNYGYNSSSYRSNFYSTINSVSHIKGNVIGTSYVGGLVGYTYGAVTSSHSAGDVTGTGSYVGGLIGNGSSIGSSYHEDGNVSGAGYYVGGLAGSGSVDSSYHIGGNVVGKYDYVGGLAGSSKKIRNSYAKATYVKGRNNVGGLSGYVTDSIDVSYFEGDSIIGITHVGGLVGYAGNTVDSSYATAHVKGDDNVGGLIGSANGDVSNSYALGNVIGDVDNSSAGNDYLGGLVGYQYGGSVSKSMALGNVFGTTTLGGLIGCFGGTTISQSYANGNVTGSYYGDPADEVGNLYIGGLVGFAKGAISTSYASGVVKGRTEEEPVYTGCMIGYVNGSLSVTKSYYDKSKCNLGIDGGEDAVTLTGTGTPDKTTAEMQTQSTFEDWDFTDTWKIMENTYPFLQIYSNSLTNAVVTTQSLEGISYDGTAKTPLVTSVTLFGETLEYETEYTITYANNVNAGTASINVCGVMPYGGCKVVNFEIAGIAVEPTIAAIDNMTYTGRALTPEIEVYNGETLLATTDYAVEYKDNVNSGTATVIVTMKGNYSGSASQTFKIEKATPVITQNPKASDVVLGQTLVSSMLTGGYANVDGEFNWKTPSTKPTLENEGYAVVFVPNDTNYTKSAEIIVPVKVLDVVYVAVHADAVTLDSVTLVKGDEYTLPAVPEKAGFVFKGLYKGTSVVGKAGDKITITENTVIDAIYEIKKFVVTFLNETVELQAGEVAYGEMPEYTGKTPTKASTVQYTYSFKEWNPELTEVTEPASYNAVFDSVVNKYVISFANGAEILQSDSVLYGNLPEYKGENTPTKSSTAKYDYTFNGWTPSIDTVKGSTTYTAIFDSTLREYTITFKDGATTLQMGDVAYGMIPNYTGVAPTKVSTAKFDYMFKGWSPSIDSVKEAAIYTAIFDSTLREYTITFKGGSTTLQTGVVAYGMIPNYTGETPTKTSSAKYDYAFKGWTPSIDTVKDDAIYTAIFDSTLREYTVTFKNGATTLQTGDVTYGTMPGYTGVAPTKISTAKYDYTFKGWSPSIDSIKETTTYTAVFDSILREYTITFKNGTTTLQTINVAYGTKPSYTGSTPTKASTDKYAYTFSGWTPTLATVTGVATYTAVFDSTLRKYTITFKDGATILQTGDVAYGIVPNYTGKTLTKTSTAKYDYTFKGWSPSIDSVKGSTTYIAVFDSSLRKYVITFMNGTTMLQMSTIAYGTSPFYSGKTPTKTSSAKYDYVFKSWSPSLDSVVGNATYSAVFDSSLRKYTITFMNGTTTLQKSDVAYGVKPSYTGSVPTKASSEKYTYTFKAWNPSISSVTGVATYYAVFDSLRVTGVAGLGLKPSGLMVQSIGRTIQISSAPAGAKYTIWDPRGREIKRGVCDASNFNIVVPRAGSYLVKVGYTTKMVRIN